jgi:hypothetical protein
MRFIYRKKQHFATHFCTDQRVVADTAILVSKRISRNNARTQWVERNLNTHLKKGKCIKTAIPVPARLLVLSTKSPQAFYSPHREPAHLLLAQALCPPRPSCSSSPPCMQFSANLTDKGGQTAATYACLGNRKKRWRNCFFRPILRWTGRGCRYLHQWPWLAKHCVWHSMSRWKPPCNSATHQGGTHHQQHSEKDMAAGKDVDQIDPGLRLKNTSSPSLSRLRPPHAPARRIPVAPLAQLVCAFLILCLPSSSPHPAALCLARSPSAAPC